jgi:ubiquitin C-terminal hydrolase
MIASSPTTPSMMTMTSSTVSTVTTITGLENFGNTCYVNSILQLLMQCQDFVDFFRKTFETQECNKTSTILQHFMTFLTHYTSPPQRRTIAPKEVMFLLNDKKDLFAPFQQYDAHEFLIQLLDILDEEIKKVWEKPCSKRFFHYLYHTIFHNVQDPRDIKQVPNYEVILTLPFSPSLIESMKLYGSMDILEDWESDRYKTKVRATKCNRIYHWPRYLFIQINRYDQNFNKIQDDMETPIRIPELNYDFIGAVIHHGHTRFGHYVSVLRCQKEFVLCDDERISVIPETRAMSLIRKAYLLLYMKND